MIMSDERGRVNWQDIREGMILISGVFKIRPGHYVFHPFGATHYFNDLNDIQRELGLPVTADKPLGVAIDAARVIVPLAAGAYLFFR